MPIHTEQNLNCLTWPSRPRVAWLLPAPWASPPNTPTPLIHSAPATLASPGPLHLLVPHLFMWAALFHPLDVISLRKPSPATPANPASHPHHYIIQVMFFSNAITLQNDLSLQSPFPPLLCQPYDSRDLSVLLPAAPTEPRTGSKC